MLTYAMHVLYCIRIYSTSIDKNPAGMIQVADRVPNLICIAITQSRVTAEGEKRTSRKDKKKVQPLNIRQRSAPVDGALVAHNRMKQSKYSILIDTM